MKQQARVKRGTSSDGEIYQNVKLYSSEEAWKYLTTQGKKNLKSLLEGKEKVGLAQSFDKLLKFPGLWNGMILTTLHKWMKYKEVGSLESRVACTET